MEEVVGEISDEYDVDNSLYTKQNDGSYVFEAKIMLTDFFKATEIDSEDFEDMESRNKRMQEESEKLRLADRKEKIEKELILKLF